MLMVKDFLLHVDHQVVCKGGACLYMTCKAHLRKVVDTEDFASNESKFQSHVDWDFLVPVSH